MLLNRNHAGSFAVRLFVEQYQPYLTFHGHIHETVQVSGDFKERINNSVSFSSGNHNIGSDLAIVVFDLYQLDKARRIIKTIY